MIKFTTDVILLIAENYNDHQGTRCEGVGNYTKDVVYDGEIVETKIFKGDTYVDIRFADGSYVADVNRDLVRVVD